MRHRLRFLIERLERARCATARETGASRVDGRAENGEEGREKKVAVFSSFLLILRAAVPLDRPSLSITVNEKRIELRAV